MSRARARDAGMKLRLLQALPLALAAAPLAWLALLYLFVLRARLHLGHWPRPYHPDPADLGFTLQRQAIWIGLTVLPFLSLSALPVVLVGRRWGIDLRLWRTLTLLAGSTILSLALGRFDPGSFLEWFAD